MFGSVVFTNQMKDKITFFMHRKKKRNPSFYLYEIEFLLQLNLKIGLHQVLYSSPVFHACIPRRAVSRLKNQRCMVFFPNNCLFSMWLISIFIEVVKLQGNKPPKDDMNIVLNEISSR